MSRSIIILILMIIIALILLLFQEKHKWLSVTLIIIGLVSTLIDFCNYFFNYDPAIELKKNIISLFEKIESDDTTPSVKVKLPKEISDSNKDVKDNNTEAYNKHLNLPIITNVGGNIDRVDGMIHIEWTPMKGKNNYSVKITAKDPISDMRQTIKYYTENNWIDIDMSTYEQREFIMISVGALNKKTNQYEYRSSIDTYLN